MRILRYVTVICLAMLAMAANPASADANFNFALAFTDGGTALGHLSEDTGGNFTFFDVVTSGPSGFEYDAANSSPSPFFSDGNLYLSFTRPGTGGYMVLEFSEPVDGNGFYDLKFAGSFECVGGTEHFALGRPTPVCSGRGARSSRPRISSCPSRHLWPCWALAW